MKLFIHNYKKLLAVLLFSFFAVMAFGQEYFGDSDSVNYRGKREPRDAGSFSVLNISTTRIDSKTVKFDILFNQAIDPKSANAADFYINGNKVSSKGKTEFSKDGKKIRVELETSDANFTFELKGILSYNGKMVNKICVKLKDNGEVRVSSE